MMRNTFGRLAVLAVLSSIVLGGCRFKGVESFISATTPNPEGSWSGDPYTGIGYAEASGGTNTKTRYGAGAKQTTSAPLDPVFDQPAKGTGHHPGENPGSAAAGFGLSNGPGMQPSVGDASSTAVRF
jgi:hypothetical protein